MFRVTNTIVENNFGAPNFWTMELLNFLIMFFSVLCHIVIALPTIATIIERAIMKRRKELKKKAKSFKNSFTRSNIKIVHLEKCKK